MHLGGCPIRPSDQTFMHKKCMDGVQHIFNRIRQRRDGNVFQQTFHAWLVIPHRVAQRFGKLGVFGHINQPILFTNIIGLSAPGQNLAFMQRGYRSP